MPVSALINEVPTSNPRVAVYLSSEEVKDKLEKLAKKERRSLSQMACLLIEQGLEQAEKEGKI